jgi:hypothetical protein
MQKCLLVILPMVFLFLFVSHAQADNSYVVHLYYDAKNDTLAFNYQQKNQVDLDKCNSIGLKEFFDNQAQIQKADYILKIQTADGSETDVMKFDKKPGAFDLHIPYFVSGVYVNIPSSDFARYLFQRQ